MKENWLRDAAYKNWMSSINAMGFEEHLIREHGLIALIYPNIPWVFLNHVIETKIDEKKVEELLDAAAGAMAWIGYEQHPADQEARERLDNGLKVQLRRRPVALLGPTDAGNTTIGDNIGRWAGNGL